MKRQLVLLSALFLVAVLTACNSVDHTVDQQPQGEPEQSTGQSAVFENTLRLEPDPSPSLPSSSEQADEPSSEPESEPEPQLEIEEPQPVSNPYQDALLVVRVVDRAGNPVQAVGGLLHLGVPTPTSSPAAVPLAGAGDMEISTGPDGVLYLAGAGISALPEEGSLYLYASHASAMDQTIPLRFAELSNDITVTWTGEAPPTSAPPPPDTSHRRIGFFIVDQNGKPVPYISGSLTQNDGRAAHYIPLRSKEWEDYEDPLSHYDPSNELMTDASGYLYVELDGGWQNRGFTLSLQAYYDPSISQQYFIELPDPPASYTITWEQPAPPSQRPPQSTGIRLFFVDPQGSPVKGITVSGVEYPRPKPGEAVPGLAMSLPPSDEKGYVRWEETRPGIYDLTGSKDGLSQTYEVVMPDDRQMVDIVLVWNP